MASGTATRSPRQASPSTSCCSGCQISGRKIWIASSLKPEARSLKPDMIRIFVTGGTFDKNYDEIHGRLTFGDTHLPEMLRLRRCRLDVSIRTLMMIDSLELTDADRGLIGRHRRP